MILSVSEIEKCGPDPVLSIQGEQELIQWIQQRFDFGVPVSKAEIIDATCKLSTSYTSAKGFGATGPSSQWYVNFMQRHPQFSKRTADNISRATAEVMREIYRSGSAKYSKHLRMPIWITTYQIPHEFSTRMKLDL